MYKRNPDFFADLTESQTIFIDMDAGVFYLLPLFASLVFRMLINGASLKDIQNTLSKIPEIPSDYTKRIDEVISELLRHKLIIESDTPETLPEININEIIIHELQESDFNYAIEPSTDLQKLLLDDPIHDVSLDGWTPVVK